MNLATDYRFFDTSEISHTSNVLSLWLRSRKVNKPASLVTFTGVKFELQFSVKIDSQSILFAFTHWVIQNITAKLPQTASTGSILPYPHFFARIYLGNTGQQQPVISEMTVIYKCMDEDSAQNACITPPNRV